MYKLINILFLLLPLVGLSQKDTLAHLYAIGGAGIDKAEEIIATTDGGYVVVGSTTSNTSGNTDVYLLKLDSQINIVWSWAIGGSNNDWGYAVKETFDKGFIIASTTNSFDINGGYNARLIKTDSLGVIQWHKVYGGSDWDLVYDVVQTADSGFAFCGETYNNTNGESDVYIVKTNLLGDTLWTKTIGGTLVDRGNSIMETTDSSIVVAGMTTTTTDSVQMYMIKLTATGNLIWDIAFGAVGYEEANAVIETTNGDYVLGGVTTSFTPNNDKDFYMIRTDISGNAIWGNYFGQPGEEVIYDLVEDATTGNLVVTGFTKAVGGGQKDAVLFAVSSSATWLNLGITFGGTKNEEAKAISFTNNKYILAGSTNNFGNGLEDFLIITLDTLLPGMDTTNTIVQDQITITINELSKQNYSFDFELFPNPVNQQYVSIRLPLTLENESFIKVFDLSGSLVYSSFFKSNNFLMDISSLNNGLYFIEISNQENVKAIKKLMVIH